MSGKSLFDIGQVLNSPCTKREVPRGYAIDSRLISPGMVFFALKGERSDGHQFLEEVAQRGGLAAVVSKEYTGKHFGLILFRVDDVLKAMHLLAKTFFSKRREKVIGITGSMGKTTTKEFLADLLETKYRVIRSFKSYNSQRTFPLTLLNLVEEVDWLVLEMAMSNKGGIAKLVDLAPPDVAICTRIAPAGIVGGSLNEISEAKAEIFASPKTKIGVISAQAAQFPAIFFAGSSRKYIYGWKEDFFDARSGDFVMEKGEYINDSPKIEFGFEGNHIKENFLAAASVARLLGISWENIIKVAKSSKPYALRYEMRELDGVTMVLDCYNANPESMKAALKNLPKPKKGGKVVGVLGSMSDLGKHTSSYHKEIGTFATDHIDHLLCIGEESKDLMKSFSASGKPASLFAENREIRKKLSTLVQPGDVLLIKGSNFLKLWEIVENAADHN